MSHTPAPWEIGNTFEFRLCLPDEEPFDAIEINSGDDNLLLVPLDNRETGLANARLAVLAPELLEALQPFANYACDLSDEEGPEAQCDCHNCTARTLIAKAKGEA